MADTQQSSWEYYSALPAALRDWYVGLNPPKKMVPTPTGGYRPAQAAAVSGLLRNGAPEPKQFGVKPNPPAYTVVQPTAAPPPRPAAAPAPQVGAQAPGQTPPAQPAPNFATGLTPGDVAGLGALAGYDEKAGDLQDQINQSRVLQNMPLPTGRQAGEVFVASNPLEMLGTGLQKYKGIRDERKQLDELKGIRNDQTAARQSYIAKILRAQQGVGSGGSPFTEDTFNGL